MLPCPLYLFTHLKCPFCGTQRGLLALWEGDISSWWHYNPVVWCMTPYLLLLIIGEIYRPLQSKRWMQCCYDDKTIFSVIGILIVWGIVRNLLDL